LISSFVHRHPLAERIDVRTVMGFCNKDELACKCSAAAAAIAHCPQAFVHLVQPEVS
jgi:hypothetical protein